MKRFISLAVSVSLIATVCKGQLKKDSTSLSRNEKFFLSMKKGKKDTLKRFAFGFNDGYGIPMANFRKTDNTKYPISRFNGQDTTKLGGYATYGFHYDFYITLKLYRQLGITISAGGNDIGYNINAVNSQFIPFFSPNTTVVTSGDNYYVLQYFIGPIYNFSFKKGFTIECRALAGLVNTNYPSLSYIDFPPVRQSQVFTFPDGNGYGYSAGIGLKYSMVEGHIGVHVNVNYSQATVNFSGYSIAYYSPPAPNTPAYSNIFLYATNFNYPKTLDVSLLQITFGISGEL